MQFAPVVHIFIAIVNKNVSDMVLLVFNINFIQMLVLDSAKQSVKDGNIYKLLYISIISLSKAASIWFWNTTYKTGNIIISERSKLVCLVIVDAPVWMEMN